MADFKQMSTEEKQKYGKQFSKREKTCYHRGKRNGWLTHYHATKNTQKSDFQNRKYSAEQINALFDDLTQVKWK